MSNTENCKCSECTLDGRDGIKKVCSTLPVGRQYNWLGIGQAPGKTENITGVPFTGSAGKMLYSCMLSAGLNKGQLPLGNLVACWPPQDSKGNDRAPDAWEIINCRPQLYETIHQVQPELILAFGGPAAKELTGKDGITKIHGGFFKLHPRYDYDCWVLCLWHPSFVMRKRDEIPVMVRDLEKVHTFFTSGPPQEVSDRTRFYLDPTAEELREYLITSYKGEVIAFDTETTSLNPREAQLLGASFSKHKDSAMAVYLNNGSDARLPIIKEFLESDVILKAAQNGSYDCAVLHTNGIYVSEKALVYDTRLAEQLLNSDSPKDLGHLRAVYTDIPPYKPTKKEMEQIQSWGKVKMLNYAALDAQCTYQVMEKQKTLLSDKQKELLQKLLVPVCFALNKMERNGIRVDVGRLALMYAETIPKIEALEKEIQAKWGVNPYSSKQVQNTFGVSDSRRETLEAHADRCGVHTDAFKLILECKALAKGASTFLKGIYERLEGDRIHTRYNPEGTGTGRLSSSNPNLQNIRKPFRIIYCSDSKDTVLIAADYSQLELHVASILAPCPALKGDLEKRADIHTRVMNMIIDHIPRHFKETKQERWIAKTVVFGSLYGRSPRSMAIFFGVSIETATLWQEGLFTQYPGLKVYMLNREEDFRRFGKVTTPFGRVRYVQNARQAINAPIQSSANDVALSKLLTLYKMGMDIRLTTHDEIVIQAPVKEVEEYAKLLKSTMEAPVSEMGDYSFPVDLKVGFNWYELKKTEDFKKEVGLCV